jgi:hypothetical protein
MQEFGDIQKEQCKAKFGLNTDKITITIGYNASNNNQHLKVLESLIASKTIRTKSFEVLLPLTYGRTKDYVDKIVLLLEKLKIEYKTLNHFLSATEVMYLRYATDIFIQAPLSDALSGSLREHIYAKNIVITGSWLPYQILNQNGIFFFKVDDFNQIPELLNTISSNFRAEKNKCDKNPELIYNISSWNRVVHDWTNLYNKLLTTS